MDELKEQGDKTWRGSSHHCFLKRVRKQKYLVFCQLVMRDCPVEAEVSIKMAVGSLSIISFLRKFHGSLTYKIKPDSSSWH